MNIAYGKSGYRTTDLAVLQLIMDRVGCTMAPEEFVDAVRDAFGASRERTVGEGLAAAFRQCPSFDCFYTALSRAKERLSRSPKILVLGAGAGILGRNSEYAASVTREVFGPSAVIHQMDVSREMLHAKPAEQYDLVVTHSLVHFLFDQVALFQYLTEAVPAGGGYVMGSEPNRRFWRNSEIQQACERMWAEDARQRRWRSLISPRTYINQFLGMFRGPSSEAEAFARNINRMLETRYSFRSALSLKELNRIVDPYFPDDLPGDCPLGAHGLDWQTELAALLPEFQFEWVATARYLGKRNPNQLPLRWRETHAELAAAHRLDGSIFSALWWRNPVP